jgi:hypothetical protein
MSTTDDINAALRRLREDNDRLREAIGAAVRELHNIYNRDAEYVENELRAALAAATATGDPWDAPEGRTQYDPAHAVAIKDAEREVLAATRDYFDDKPAAFSRLAIANAALRALEQQP